MKAFDPIPLNSNWQIDGTDPLSNLSGWSQNFAKCENAELHRIFDLEPIGEVCLRFFLHIQAAPDGTVVKMNSWDVGMICDGQALVVDVTDFVTLEDNVLLLTVSKWGKFGEVWLECVPCETI